MKIVVKKSGKISAPMAMGLLFLTVSFGMELPEEYNLLLNLPAELQVNVLSHLNAKELIIVSEVNKAMNELSKDDHLWKKLCAQEGYSLPPEGAIWGDYYKNKNTTKIIRLTAYINPRDRDRRDRVSVQFKGAEYQFILCQADINGRVPLATDLVMKRADVLNGLPLIYSVTRSLLSSPNALESREVVSGNVVFNRLAGTVTKELFFKFCDQEGRPAEPASIQLHLEKLDEGKMGYGYVLK